MTQASKWLSIAEPLVPSDTPLLSATRALWILSDAAVWQGETGYRGWLWRFEDGSSLLANESGCMLLPGEFVR
jgi:hypothetical protein